MKAMETATSTEDINLDIKTHQENILLEIIKDLCNDVDIDLSSTLVEKVRGIIADSELKHYASLHKLNTADERTSTLLGALQQTVFELTFDEQEALNTAIVQKLQSKLSTLITELDCLQENMSHSEQSQMDEMKELHESIDDKFKILENQAIEKMEVMMKWMDHRREFALKFSNDLNEYLTLKTRILEMKSKIINLQVLHSIFTETSMSIKAYSEIQKDLKASIVAMEQQIKECKHIVEND